MTRQDSDIIIIGEGRMRFKACCMGFSLHGRYTLGALCANMIRGQE